MSSGVVQTEVGAAAAGWPREATTRRRYADAADRRIRNRDVTTYHHYIYTTVTLRHIAANDAR